MKQHKYIMQRDCSDERDRRFLIAVKEYHEEHRKQRRSFETPEEYAKNLERGTHLINAIDYVLSLPRSM